MSFADSVSLVGNLAELVLGKLDRLIQIVDTSPTHVAAGASGMQERLDNWPVEGEQRIVTADRSSGGPNVLGAAAWTDLLDRDAGRGGMQIMNVGANPVFLYLAKAGDAQQGGKAQLWLAGNGGSWDGRISGEMWCGPISANSALGTTLALAVI